MRRHQPNQKPQTSPDVCCRLIVCMLPRLRPLPAAMATLAALSPRPPAAPPEAQSVLAPAARLCRLPFPLLHVAYRACGGPVAKHDAVHATPPQL